LTKNGPINTVNVGLEVYSTGSKDLKNVSKICFIEVKKNCGQNGPVNTVNVEVDVYSTCIH
jgi:hypothetical protein